MAVGKGSLDRVAKATIGAPAPEVAKATAPVTEKPVVEKKPAVKKNIAAKITIIYGVGDELPVYLL